MRERVRWGVLSTANIGVKQVIPAMQLGEWSEVTAIASRDLTRARQVAQELGIARAYGSYDELLADNDIEAIYNPLPNHLHVPWTIKAAEAGKHVLCEKPIALNASEAEQLIAARDHTGVRIQEAFMVRTHPRWLRVRELINSGRIGELRVIIGFFSYFNRDPENVRNQPDGGGGGLLDIGCYPITLSRFIFNTEPLRVVGMLENDPEMGIDRLTSAMLEYPNGQATFTCSTQLAHYQRMQFFGTQGRIEVPIPFNAPAQEPTRIFLNDISDMAGLKTETIEIPACNQYTVQGDRFSRAIRENTPQPVPLEDAVKNLRVIDAIFQSAREQTWQKLG